jgi:cyclic pyranopterin phosphate synthase
MVDVGNKKSTTRVARASATVLLGATAFDLVSRNAIQKGDVLTVAKIAGISAAKQTHVLIPLCHSLSLRKVTVDLTLDATKNAVRVESSATCDGKTGVEMEALVAASVAGLTVYDMCKAASKDIVISDVRLESKTGGKSGDYARDA